ncbi:hypothetical protein MHU86_15216 [Fragilaria crotonensis]|nr:hypothetical protein MHU86_15216 [Fragilaria crotonensis]
MPPTVDASNSCIPLTSPLAHLSPPLPTTTRGEPTVLDGNPGRLNSDRPIIVYGSGRLVVVRELGEEGSSNNDNKTFVYRGHMATVTCARFSPSGCYVASADVRGKLRVWSWDNDEHLCKLDLNVLTGPIRCIAWDFESKRICFAGERSDASSDCVRVIQWDTGVTCGELAQHSRGRASSCDLKPNRPMRLVTGGMDDSRVYCNAGPPFKRVTDGVPTESVHVKGAVNGLRYSADGRWWFRWVQTRPWQSDGTAKLLSAEPLEVVHTWDVVEFLGASRGESVPIGAMVVGCTFAKNDIPVVVTINGEISLLPKPPLFTTGLDAYQKLTGHVAPIAGMAIDNTRGLVYTADTDGVLCQYSLATGEPIQRFSSQGSTDLLGKMHGEATISCLTVVAGGSVLTAGWDDAVRIIDSEGQVVERSIAMPAQPNAMATGTQLTAVVTVGGLVLIQNGDAVSPLNVLGYNALSVCVSSDDSTIYVGGEDCQIHVYRVSSSFALDEVHIIEGAHLKPVHALSLSNDATKLASADVRDVCVWDLSKAYSPIISKSRWCFLHPTHYQFGLVTRRQGPCEWWCRRFNLPVEFDKAHEAHSLRIFASRWSYGIGVLSGETVKGCGQLISVGADSCVNQWMCNLILPPNLHKTTQRIGVNS